MAGTSGPAEEEVAFSSDHGSDGLHRTRVGQRGIDQTEDFRNAEPPQKKANLGGAAGTDVSTTGAISRTWSWPSRVDEFAQGSHAECIAATDDTGAELSWSQLAHRSKLVAKALRKKMLSGVPTSAYPRFPGDTVVAPEPIVIMLNHTVDALAIILGVLREGFPLLPLSITHSNREQLLKRYGEAMELFRPAAIISDSPLAQHLLETRPGTEIVSPQHLLLGEGSTDDYEDVTTTLDHVLAYIFTSGTSGGSKCVTATNRMASAEVDWYPQIFHQLGIKVDPRKDRWRNDHEMGWWGAAYFGEIDVALAMQMGIVMMKPNDSDVASRGVTMMGALPSQLQNLWPTPSNRPTTLRVIFSWAERCEVDLGQAWKKSGVKIADLLIASEFFLCLASCNLEVVRGDDGRAAHAMRAVRGAKVLVLDDKFQALPASADGDVTGMIAIGGPHVSPGYAERLDGGITVIGGGEMSKGAFRWIDGDWVVVPKDIVKRRPDGSFLSVGRAGGTVKVKGGVLMATNVVETQLQQASVAVACITDPIHVEGGSCVVLQMDWQDVWSLKDSLQRASFLRMPIIFVCEMPRNESTGKVQKALVQADLEREHEAEMNVAEELYINQRNQLVWYAQIAKPFLLACAIQPLTFASLCKALLQLDAWRVIAACGNFSSQVVMTWCLVAWVCSASAHAARLGRTSNPFSVSTQLVLVLVSCRASNSTLVTSLASFSLVGMVVVYGILQKKVDMEDGDGSGLLVAFFCRVHRLLFALGVALTSQMLPLPGLTVNFCAGLLSIFAMNRYLPTTQWHWSVGPESLVFQGAFATAYSVLEAFQYMMSLTVAFPFLVPSLVLSKHPNFAWARLKNEGCALPHEGESWPYSGARKQLSQVTSQWASDGTVWIDVKGDYQCEAATVERKEVQAETPAGMHAQGLARQAGVDFQGVDSLRISRLSVLIKKHLKQKPNQDPIEMNELREACASEQSFVSLIDTRMLISEASEAFQSVAEQSTWFDDFALWVSGGLLVHREGATQAPWDCQVDMLVEWKGPHPIDHEKLCNAYNDVVQQHPMLRAMPPPDDSTDSLMGTGRNDFSTTVASTWTLLTSVWSRHASWTWRTSRTVRWIVSNALWYCWPRTLIMTKDARKRLNIPQLFGDFDGWTRNVADEVHGVIGKHWNSWWKPSSVVNACLVTLHGGDAPRQFLYCSISHKYSDGGSVGAFVHELGECYESQLRGARSSHVESPVLKVQEQRLKRYLSGDACPQGSVDVYLFDINHDIFNHGKGNGLGVYFTDNVCNAMRMVGLRLACSEEIAWLACITCALCRMMPDEKVIKILIVHNGRMGEAEGAIACVSQYVMLSIPRTNKSSNTPLADIATRVKLAITHGKFTRPGPCEQAHAKINIGGMAGKDGHFSQIFKTHRCKKASQSRALHVLQLRMDNEGGNWSVKDYKCLGKFDAKVFWEMVVCACLEIADGWFNNPLAWD